MLKSWYKNRFVKYANENDNYKMSKYVNKYIMKGGGSYEDLLAESADGAPLHTKTYCADTSFSNHIGECWHDSSTMIFCFTDGIKETVQKKLLNLTPEQIIRMARENDRLKYLAPCFREDETFFRRLENYLRLLQNRFCAHTRIITEDGKVGETRMCTKRGSTIGLGEKYCSTHDYPINFKRRRDSHVTGIHSAKILQTMMHDHPDIGYESDDDYTKYRTSYAGNQDDMDDVYFEIDDYDGIIEQQSSTQKAESLPLGETSIGENIMVHILSFCLLDNNTIITYNEFGRSDVKINKIWLDYSLAINIYIIGHAMAIYKCNGVDIFYNPNYPNIIQDEYEDDVHEKYGLKTTEKASKLVINRGKIFDLLSQDDNWDLYVSHGKHTHPILYNDSTGEIQSTGPDGTPTPSKLNHKMFAKVTSFGNIDGLNVVDPNENKYLAKVFALSSIHSNSTFDGINFAILTDDLVFIAMRIFRTHADHAKRAMMFRHFIKKIKNDKIDSKQIFTSLCKIFLFNQDYLMFEIILDNIEMDDTSPMYNLYDVYEFLYNMYSTYRKELDAKVSIHGALQTMYRKNKMDKIIDKIKSNIHHAILPKSSTIKFLSGAISKLYIENPEIFPAIKKTIQMIDELSLFDTTDYENLIAILSPDDRENIYT